MTAIYHREQDLSEDVLSWEEKYDFEISDLITSARLRKGWTQTQLAEKIGTQQPSIARAESGGSLASHGLLKKVAYALDTELLPPRFAFMDEAGIDNLAAGGWLHDRAPQSYNYWVPTISTQSKSDWTDASGFTESMGVSIKTVATSEKVATVNQAWALN